MKRRRRKGQRHRTSRQDQRMALEQFSSDAFLIVNKRLLKKIGLAKTIFLSNLIDKYRYFEAAGQLQKDGSFFLIHEQQQEDIGLEIRQIQNGKRYLKKAGILKTIRRGIPAKEFYFLDFTQLLQWYLEDEGTDEGTDAPDAFPQEDPKVVPLGDPKVVPLGDPKVVPLGDPKVVPLIKDTKFNNTKERNISGGKESEEETVSAKSSRTSKISEHIPLASQLAKIVQSTKNIRISQQRINSWADDIRKLVQIEKVDPSRIRLALDWYEDNVGGEYIPVIESGSSLRSKFTRLEDAIERTERKSPRPRISVSGNFDSEKFFKKKLGSLAPGFIRSCYEPAKDTISAPPRELARTLLTLYEEIYEQQKRHTSPELARLLPSAAAIVEGYVEWIEENDWIQNKSISLLDMGHSLFGRFRRQEAQKDNLQRDPITGNSHLKG